METSPIRAPRFFPVSLRLLLAVSGISFLMAWWLWGAFNEELASLSRFGADLGLESLALYLSLGVLIGWGVSRLQALLVLKKFRNSGLPGSAASRVGIWRRTKKWFGEPLILLPLWALFTLILWALVKAGVGGIFFFLLFALSGLFLLLFYTVTRVLASEPKRG